MWTEAPWDGDDSVTKGFLIVNKAPKTKQVQVHKIQTPSEKIPGDTPPVFAAHWLPRPAHPSSAAQLLPGWGAAWNPPRENITLSGIRPFSVLFLFQSHGKYSQLTTASELWQPCLRPPLKPVGWHGLQGWEDAAAKPPLEAALVGFPFQALLLKILKAPIKRPFLKTVSPDSLRELGAQPMGARRLLEGVTTARGRSRGKDQPWAGQG